MQIGTWMSWREIMREVMRAVMGITLLTLVAGVWACLWVPPSF